MRWQFLNRTLSTLFFYFGWIVCLQEASSGHSFYGLWMVFGMILYYLFCSKCRKADYLLLTLVVLIGPLSDILYTQLGIFKYHSHHQHALSAWIPPLWVFFLWGLFGINIHLFSWLNHRWWLAIILGALGGPMSYLSVVRLGGVSLLKSYPLAFLTIGGIWAIFLPCFILLNEFLKKRFRENP